METLTKQINGVEVVSPAEISVKFGVSLPGVYVWARQSDFPKPVFTMGGETRKRHLYSLAEVSEWVALHQSTKAGRGRANLIGRRVLTMAHTDPELYAQIISLIDEHGERLSASMDRHPSAR